MLNIYFYFILMLMMFFMLLFISVLIYYLDLGVILEWCFFSVNTLNLEVLIYVDWVAMLFISLIFLISSMILIYSYEYMSSDKYLSRFIYLLLVFIFSMIFMIISPNIISILLGWDGLGLVSYCLIIYYQNVNSYNSGMVTVLCNRLGDVGLLMGIGLLMMIGCWDMSGMKLFCGGFFFSVFIFMMLLAGMTKSAQIPFSTWLPMAMAAPTPISALVHSSTLVTAGVYLLIRFNKFLMMSEFSKGLFYLSILTMFMAGAVANVEFDVKKIIALSTLSQLGLMMMVLSLGGKMWAFFHLLTHAIFKSMLFMCAGIIIHLMGDSQDIRFFGGLNEIIPFVMMSFMVSSLALGGMPFLAGFYSKDLIMEYIYVEFINVLLLMMILLSLMFTVSYSVRMIYYVYFGEMKFMSSGGKFSESNLMNFSMLVLIILSIMVGAVLNWLFFFDYYLFIMKMEIKLITLVICLMGSGMGMMEVKLNFLSGKYCLGWFLNSMMFMNYIYMWMYNPVCWLGGFFYEIDKVWVEYLMKNFVIYINIMSNKMYLNFKIYKILSFMIMSIVVISLI